MPVNSSVSPTSWIRLVGGRPITAIRKGTIPAIAYVYTRVNISHVHTCHAAGGPVGRGTCIIPLSWLCSRRCDVCGTGVPRRALHVPSARMHVNIQGKLLHDTGSVLDTGDTPQEYKYFRPTIRAGDVVESAVIQVLSVTVAFTPHPRPTAHESG